MEAFTQFFNNLFTKLAGANFALLAIIDFAAFAVVFLAAFVACLLSNGARAHCKRPFLYAVNAFTALTLAVFATAYPLAQSVAAAAIFWFAGFMLYGVLCLFKGKAEEEKLSQPPVQTISRQHTTDYSPAPAAPAAQPTVRLDHALSIADKLLLKNLGRSDRQELERMKTALTVLKVKGALSPQEGEALNETFNALLKLMAKYDL